MALVSYEYQPALISRWIDRGRNEPEPVDRFISLWIGFEAFLSAHLPLADGLRAKVGEFAWEIEAMWIPTINTDPALSAAVNALRGLGRVQRMDSAGSARARRDNADSVLQTLYAVRNNLFHGKQDARC